MMLIAIFYQIILILGDSILLDEFELGAEVLDVYSVNDKCLESISDEDFIFYYI